MCARVHSRNNERVLNAIKEDRPSAVVMPISFAMNGLMRALKERTDIPIYVHTVNDKELAACLMALGAAGIYSDVLGEPDITALGRPPESCRAARSN